MNIFTGTRRDAHCRKCLMGVRSGNIEVGASKQKAKPNRKTSPAKQKPRKFSFCYGFFLAAVFLLICMIFLPVRYETNDDFSNIMRLNRQGDFEPGVMSPYLSQTLWTVLSLLYQHAPTVPWYGLSVYLAIFAGMGLIVSLCIRHWDKASSVIFLPALFVFFLHCAVYASFTAASLLLALAVFLSLLEWVLRGSCPARSCKAYGALLLCGLIVSYCLRWELFLWGLAFAFPVLLFTTRQQVRKAVPFIVVLLAVIASDRVFFHVTISSESREFITYEKLRRSFTDTVKGLFYKDRTPAALAKTGWTIEDYVTFGRWILYDDTMFNTDRLRTFLNENDPQQSPSILSLISKRLGVNYKKSKYYTLVFILTILAFILSRWVRLITLPREDAIRIVLVIGGILAMILFFAYYRFQARVYIPLYAYAVTMSLVLLQVKAPHGENARTEKVPVFLAICIAALTIGAYGAAFARGNEVFRSLDASRNKKRYVVQCLNVVKSREAGVDPILVLMDPSDSLCRESVHPIREMADYVDLMFMPGGTDINSPRYYQILRTLNLASGHEFLRWTIDNDRILFALFAGGTAHHDDYAQMWLSYLNRRICTEGGVKFMRAFDFRNKSGVGLVLYKAIKNRS